MKSNVKVVQFKRQPGDTATPVAVVRNTRRVRDLIRHFLWRDGKTIKNDLSQIWGVTPKSSWRLMGNWNKEPIGPERVDKLIKALELDEEEALELHQKGAREAGWRI